jgi:hypothetical protein
MLSSLSLYPVYPPPRQKLVPHYLRTFNNDPYDLLHHFTETDESVILAEAKLQGTKLQYNNRQNQHNPPHISCQSTGQHDNYSQGHTDLL